MLNALRNREDLNPALLRLGLSRIWVTSYLIKAKVANIADYLCRRFDVAPLFFIFAAILGLFSNSDSGVTGDGDGDGGV